MFQGRVCRCQFQCGEIEHEDKVQLFQEFYKLDYNAQTLFLKEVCLTVGDVKRRRVRENCSTRHCTIQYNIKTNESIYRVCQKTLCAIYKVTPRRLQILLEKIKYNKPLNDGRGAHKNRPNKVPDENKDLVKDHIASFPLQENHYSRNESTKQCLSPDLSIEKMWKLFKEKYPDTKVTLHCYRDIFNTKFKLRFGVPRSDTCELCDSNFLKMKSVNDPDKLRQIEIESKIHHARADSA